MYCKYCGSEIPPGSVFCNYCGKNLGKYKNKKETAWQEKSTSYSYKEHPEQETFEKATYKGDTDDVVGQVNITGDLNFLWNNIKKVLRILWQGIKIILVIVAILYTMDPYRNIINIKDMRKAYSCAQEVISDDLLVKEYEFPRFEPEFVTQRTKTIEYEGVEYRVHTVSSYVYAENMFGVMMRTDYVVEIGFPTDSDVSGYYYEIISIE